MRGLEPKHYMLLSGFIGALAIQIGGLQHGWHDAVSPAFVAGLLLQISTMLGALYAGAPGATGQMTDKRNPDQLPEATGVSGLSPVKDLGRLQGPPAVLLALGLCLGGGLFLPACAGNTSAVVQPVRPPEVVRAQQAGEVIQRIGELQQVVIDGQRMGKIKTEDARVIVTWTVATIKRLKEAPAGWAVVALGGWQDVRTTLLRDPNLSIWVGVVDELLKGGL